ncbi:hypothetical protein BKA70DRAFT_1215191 [Coprinopsis sp. MPI-PUGE-AT-0042]|nr:hypothetical protein BKA70DRAFT_1215191 [Coprinopsis sp. MPI-PUGE-AT-0042]
MVYAPSKVYTGEGEEQSWVYGEMWEGRWWNLLQSKVPGSSTISPIIIATDKTQLTQFTGGKSAYPMYLTIGNIPKSIRRKPSRSACILIAYLPVDKLDRANTTELEHRSRVHRMFHESMCIILEPLKQAGLTGVEMESSNGDVRRVHPILSCYVADYPEQCLVACAKQTTCPKCKCGSKELHSSKTFERRSRQWMEEIIANAKAESGGSLKVFHQECMKHDVGGYVFEPFWKDLPFTDIHRIITPDVLHQLYQGVLKTVIDWCKDIVGEKHLDRRLRMLPPVHGLRHFKNGISSLSQITGSERKDIAKVLLACLHGIVPDNGIKAVRSLLDFIYLAQYPMHDTQTLKYLRSALNDFQKYRSYFIDVGCHPTLNIPKFHSLVHYIEAIELFDTTDNYNTEAFERFHIDFAKLGWRATNHCDEFPQMIVWLSRQEKVREFELQLNAAQASPSTPSTSQTTEPVVHRPSILISKKPVAQNYPVSKVETSHRAPYFSTHLKEYLNDLLPHPIGQRRLTYASLPFDSITLFNQFRFTPGQLLDEEETVHIVKASDKRFDTVVVMEHDNAEGTALEGTRIGQVRVIFKLPQTLRCPGGVEASPATWPTAPLAAKA